MLVSFPSRGRMLKGHLHTPRGEGPFPAVLWSHGSERDPGARDELGAFYGCAGYVVFVPHRHGHGRSPGAHFEDSLRPQLLRMPRTSAIKAVIGLHESLRHDTLAALRWLMTQPFIDARRVAVSGVSHGGIQTLLAAEVDAGARAYVPFSPGATGWEGNPELQARLVTAVERARSPIFLIQAANDHSLGPSTVLGEALRAQRGLSRAHVYPPYGDTPDAGHGAFACVGFGTWGSDVLAFLAEALGAPAVRRCRSASSGRASSIAKQ